MPLYAGLDLHSRNTYIGILDQQFNRVFKKRVRNDLVLIVETIKPFGNEPATWRQTDQADARQGEGKHGDRHATDNAVKLTDAIMAEGVNNGAG